MTIIINLDSKIVTVVNNEKLWYYNVAECELTEIRRGRVLGGFGAGAVKNFSSKNCTVLIMFLAETILVSRNRHRGGSVGLKM